MTAGSCFVCSGMSGMCQACADTAVLEFTSVLKPICITLMFASSLAVSCPSTDNLVPSPPRCATTLRDCQRCGRKRHWKLWRHPCGHHFCPDCMDTIIDAGFRNIEGLDSSPCPVCRRQAIPAVWLYRYTLYIYTVYRSNGGVIWQQW